MDSNLWRVMSQRSVGLGKGTQGWKDGSTLAVGLPSYIIAQASQEAQMTKEQVQKQLASYQQDHQKVMKQAVALEGAILALKAQLESWDAPSEPVTVGD